MHKKTLIAVLFTGIIMAGSVSFRQRLTLFQPMNHTADRTPYHKYCKWTGGKINGPSSPNQSAAGDQVVSFARQYLGNPYRYGGTSLTEGADCSGFVQSVYKNFGINLPRTSQDQAAAGVDAGGIENARPGDLISYIGHIGIYAGNGQLIHASGPEDGIKISNVEFQPIQSVRRILNNREKTEGKHTHSLSRSHRINILRLLLSSLFKRVINF